MSLRLSLSFLFTAGLAAALAAPACSSEEAASRPADAGSDAPDGELGPQSPGGPCSCDTDCIGTDSHPALCLHGMCATRAAAPCAAAGSEEGCEGGALCFDSVALGENGLCLPLFDAATCSGGAENRRGVCAPIKGSGCDASCGSLCELPLAPIGSAGSACSDNAECNFSDAECYEGSSWFDGYCLSFGCTDPAACGEGGDCLPVATDPSLGVCVQKCGLDLDCRLGYVCSKLEQADGAYCRPGCDAAASCPNGYVCLGTKCIDESVACSEKIPYGTCPGDMWCDQGTCSDQPFACDGKDDALEDNDTRESAKPAPGGTTLGLFSCAGDDDWFEVVVPKGKIVRVGIEFQNGAGDLDLVVHDATGGLVGSRYGKSYPYNYRGQETNSEYFGLWSEAGGDKYYFRVVGYKQAENLYSLHVDEYDYQDAATCTSVASLEDCVGKAPNGEKLLPFPFPDPNATFLGNNYVWDTYANYRFGRRELIMLVRHAIAETSKAFPGTTPLGLIDFGDINGITPGYDVGDPRHPESTHDQGGNIDIAYYQTDGANNAEIVCNDGSVHNDGFCSPAATDKHKVDLPRQAFFMAKLFASSRLRVIGVDQVLAPLIHQTAKQLAALPASDPQQITASELMGFGNRMAFGSGWPFHHHHIHVSLSWWTSSQIAPPVGGQSARPGIRRDAALQTDLRSAWPPRETR
jgi:hypothetical protein